MTNAICRTITVSMFMSKSFKDCCLPHTDESNPVDSLNHTSVFYKLDKYRSTLFWKTKRKVKFSLEQAMKAQKGSRGIALLFL